ncbi:MAG TPA: OmpA family protein, partial [Amaricoccus sp.]|nr:OmpA family protein [Amaricoccus sp.]
PVADNATADGRAQNRRIEFTALAAEEGAEGEAAATTADDAACLEAVAAIMSRSTIQFAPGSADLAPESEAVLDQIVAALRPCPEVAMEIGGHTDSEGSDSGNERLSQRRAEAVLAGLRERGLALAQATARGYGESRPVADNATADGRAANRRIEFGAVVAEGDAATDDGEDGDGPQ